MIRYTGNPYVDAGVAVLELRLHKACDEFTQADLDAQAEEIRKEYTKKIWKSYLTVHLPNCAWTQTNLSSEKNQEYLKRVLHSYKPEFPNLDRKCAFCGAPAKILADRRYVPLLTGETVMTSGAGGLPGLPVCGWCVFAVHFYPFATLKVEGCPLFWWAPDPIWTLRLTRTFVEKLERILSMVTDELPKIRWRGTQLLQAARDTLIKLQDEKLSLSPSLVDVIGIHATNYGPEPNFEEVRIPRGLLDFWIEAGSFPAYRDIERRAWQVHELKSKSKKKSRKRKESSGEAKEQADVLPEIAELTRKNYLYEALSEAFRSADYRERAKHVAVRFFLQKNGKQVVPGTIQITELFLEKVAGMERQRLEAIREIADAIVNSRDPKWMINRLMRSGKSLYDFIPVVRAIQHKLSSEHKSIGWEKILLALNLSDEEDATPRDTWLVSELILTRIFERLSQSQSGLLADIDNPEEVAPVVSAVQGGN
jgi:CRISPR-associated protein Cst1